MREGGRESGASRAGIHSEHSEAMRGLKKDVTCSNTCAAPGRLGIGSWSLIHQPRRPKYVQIFPGTCPSPGGHAAGPPPSTAPPACSSTCTVSTCPQATLSKLLPSLPVISGLLSLALHLLIFRALSSRSIWSRGLLVFLLGTFSEPALQTRHWSRLPTWKTRWGGRAGSLGDDLWFRPAPGFLK